MSQMAAEFTGLGLIVLFGTGVVQAGKYFEGAQITLGTIAAVWAAAIGIAIWIATPISGALLNPAVGVVLALRGKLGWAKLGYLTIAQLAGASAAAGLNFISFGPQIAASEATHAVVRGSAGSAAASAVGVLSFGGAGLSPMKALLTEAWGTALMVFTANVVSDPSNDAVPPGFAPLIIGVVVALVITVIGPLTGAGLNPARDLGPRLLASLSGWGLDAFANWPGYTLGPLIGAAAAIGLYEGVFRPAMRHRAKA